MRLFRVLRGGSDEVARFQDPALVGGVSSVWFVFVGGSVVGGRDWVRNREETMSDAVEHPKHYTSDPSGVECIQVTRHRNFNVGNAIKYLWRAGLKDSAGRTALDKQVEDLEKARWYIGDEIARLKGDA